MATSDKARQAPPLTPEAAQDSRSVLWRIVSATLSGALIVLIFGGILPQIADFNEVWAAMADMSAAEVGLLLAGGVLVMTLSAATMETPISELRLPRAFVAQQASTAVSNVIPGPSGTAARFVILRSWGVSVEDFTRSMFAVSIWSNVCMISMPGVAFLVLAILDHERFASGRLFWFAVAALTVSAVALVVVAGLLRSVGFARWLGRTAEAVVGLGARLLRRPAPTGYADRAASLRENTVAILRTCGTRLTTLTLCNYWLNGVLLVYALWAVGVSRDELPLIVGLALYSVGRLSTVIQVTPGGVGVVEVAYTAVYVAVLGESQYDTVVAGVLVYRALTYLMPILVGAVCYLIWRWSRRHARR